MKPRTTWKSLGTALGLALALVTIGVSGAQSQPCPKGTLRLYASWTLASEGPGMKNGLELAVAEAGGAVAGYCLEVVNLDNTSPQTGKWDEAAEAENARKAVADKQAIVYIGPYNSGAAMISARITNRASMAQITVGATYPGLTKQGLSRPGEPWTYRPLGLVNFFRAVPADDFQGHAGAAWAKRLGAKKVFLLNDGELYGRGISDIFEASARRMGLEILANETFDWKQQDQQPILSKIRDSGADLVYIGAVVETGAPLIVRQMLEAHLVAPHVRAMGPEGLLQEELLRRATCDAVLATELRVTFPGLPIDKMTAVGAKTYSEYKSRFGAEPSPFALYATEAGRVAIDGIRRAAPELDRASDPTDKRDAVRRAIAATKDFGGINSTWRFDRHGDIDQSTTSGFKVVKWTENPLGCRFQFESIVE